MADVFPRPVIGTRIARSARVGIEKMALQIPFTIGDNFFHLEINIPKGTAITKAIRTAMNVIYTCSVRQVRILS